MYKLTKLLGQEPFWLTGVDIRELSACNSKQHKHYERNTKCFSLTNQIHYLLAWKYKFRNLLLKLPNELAGKLPLVS